MSKSRRNWLFSGALVATAAVMVTSAAVGVGFRVRPASRLSIPDPVEETAGGDGVTAAKHFAPSPPVNEASAPRVTATLPWDVRGRAGPFPRVRDGAGQLASADVRNPGSHINEATTGEGTERAVPRLSHRASPVVSSGRLGAGDFESEIRARRPEIGRCAGKGLVVGGDVQPPTGKLALRWVVRADGSSNDLVVKENTLEDATLSRCILTTVSHWRFSPPSGGDAPVESTFMFL